MDFSRLSIAPPDADAMARAQARLNQIAKPIGSLGKLESMLVQIAGLSGSSDIDIGKRAVIALCADNGVARRGIAITPVHITRAVAENMANGSACVCIMGRCAGADVIAVDVGMFEESNLDGLMKRRIAAGTGDIAAGPAMTRDQALEAIGVGVDMVARLKADGYRLLAAGEMGVANTTTASAVCSVLLSRPIEQVTGPGAGLSDAGLLRKIDIIKQAVAINRPDPGDALDVLSKLGGFDIAAMCGVFLGGAIHRVPVLIDGFISAVSALVAKRLCPDAACAMLPSHVSAEPAGALVLEALGLSPIISADMRLGEGTGAVAAMPMLDMALAIYREMMTFSQIGM